MIHFQMSYLDNYKKKIYLNMPINVFGNSSHDNNNIKIDISLFVQKPTLRSNYIEANIEEDINMKKPI